MANTDPRFAQSRFATGVKRSATTDPRFAAGLSSPRAGYASAPPRRYSPSGRDAGTAHDGDLATRRARFAESAERMQYKKPVVVAQRGRSRGE